MNMKTITRTGLQLSVISGAALAFTAMATLPFAHRALAQDAPTAEASADASSPDAVIDVTGSWSGTITDDVAGLGTITLSLSQSGRDLRSGSGWTATFNDFPGTPPEFVGGMANGSKVNEKSVVILRLVSASFDKKECRVVFKSTTANGTEIQGNYKYVNCGKQFKGNKGGTISVTPTPTM
jgi:hypothetical protein